MDHLIDAREIQHDVRQGTADMVAQNINNTSLSMYKKAYIYRKDIQRLIARARIPIRKKEILPCSQYITD
jgi:hypothetical protein